MDNLENIGVSCIPSSLDPLMLPLTRDQIVKERVMPTNSTMRFLNCEVKRNRWIVKRIFGVVVPIWEERLMGQVLDVIDRQDPDRG